MFAPLNKPVIPPILATQPKPADDGRQIDLPVGEVEPTKNNTAQK